ncbi:NAD(P)/FAD-dependent oxidoreductase [Nannocystis sp. ILAH1]|uniref:FAD-dependent oxidoreductase n=1 Tax=unclassified Nannocystis TaxID=2627009 RepID=UPI002271CCA3|nr:MULTISPECIES: NAD(P)/FAD-dependent oxidoreductase [unclassified Nannocystis]MCY0988615.1 NAD(P)/FAD-dependent oxidoreductase [Nannocystis sp. ILAH1]MCY1067421.1 NAD(P)/FAD-dependent oxidoreductase [Nannocystis sp. RBIL2]
MNLSQLHVLVVGGATGGAATALLLARAGARVTLLEKVAQPRAVGAGIGLAENGLAVLESIGLGPAIAAHGRAVDSPAIVDGRSRLMLAPPRPTPRVRMIRRSDLQGLLLDALAAEPRVERQFGAEVIGAERDGRVTARVDGRTVEHRADLVVGADGVHSRIRTAGDFGARVRPPGIAYLRALVDVEAAQGVEAWTGAGIFGSFAVDGGTYFFASAGTRACRHAIAARDLEALRAVWARAYPPSIPLLGAVRRFDDLIFNRVIRVDCQRWVDGRLALLGDAAHAMSPNLGQGANSALVDAAVLLDELRRAADLASGLDAYQRRRRPAVQRVARAAGSMGALAEITNPVARWLRDRLLLPVAARFGGDAAAVVMQELPATLLAIGRA